VGAALAATIAAKAAPTHARKLLPNYLTAGAQMMRSIIRPEISCSGIGVSLSGMLRLIRRGQSSLKPD